MYPLPPRALPTLCIYTATGSGSGLTKPNHDVLTPCPSINAPASVIESVPGRETAARNRSEGFGGRSFGALSTILKASDEVE